MRHEHYISVEKKNERREKNRTKERNRKREHNFSAKTGMKEMMKDAK
jgi:hypothetical protein